MGPNLTEKAARTARSVSMLHIFTQAFDNQSHVPFTSTAHTIQSEDDVAKAVSVLLKKTNLEVIQGRKHTMFSMIKEDPCMDWIERK